jgi:hypothetical protein
MVGNDSYLATASLLTASDGVKASDSMKRCTQFGRARDLPQLFSRS